MIVTNNTEEIITQACIDDFSYLQGKPLQRYDPFR